MGIYVGVNGTPKEVTAVYVGVNGVPKECSDIYVGVNGTPKPAYSGVKPGETVFTSSTNFTVPRGVKKIDCFCVGGGGGNGMYGLTPTSVSGGGTSSVGDICSAAGGKESILSSVKGSDGTDGGSGGGAAAYGEVLGSGKHRYGGAGGTDGGDGETIRGFNGTQWWAAVGGKGQGTTTRYFGESNGTLYASGGAGGFHGSAIEGESGGGANTGGGAAGGYGVGIAGGGGGGYTKTVLGASVTPGQEIPVVVGEGSKSVYIRSGSSTLYKDCGSSGICIIRWDDQKS